jgi:hypothetical protein
VGLRDALVIFVLFGVMLIITGCCGATGQVAKTPSAEAQVQNTPAAAPPANNADENANVEDGIVGTIYTVNYLGSKYQVTLKEAEFASSTNPYLAGNYLMAYFEIKNVGDASQTFAPDIYALSSDGEKYDKTIAIGLGDKYSDTLELIKTLPPNTKTSGWTAIEVPDGTTEMDLYFAYTNPYLSKTPKYIKYSVHSTN